MIGTIEEDNLYYFTQVSLKNYFWKKLTTSKMSVATVHKSSQDFPTLYEVVFKSYLDKDQEIKKMVNPKLCCPELLNMELDVFPGCTNKQCNKPLNLLPVAKFVTCHHCSRTMRAYKCSWVIHCVMSFEDKMLTLPVEDVSAFLKEEAIKMYQADIDTFKEKLLFLENVDYIYNSKNLIAALF